MAAATAVEMYHHPRRVGGPNSMDLGALPPEAIGVAAVYSLWPRGIFRPATTSRNEKSGFAV